jgi:hypothetical protein
MEKDKESRILSRRDALKLAGAAAAFCASFGFLHGEGEASPQVQSKFIKLDQPDLMRQHKIKWERAQMKWYAGDQLLYAADFPSVVLKLLQNDMNATIHIKWYRTGILQQTMLKIEAKT